MNRIILSSGTDLAHSSPLLFFVGYPGMTHRTAASSPRGMKQYHREEINTSVKTTEKHLQSFALHDLFLRKAVLITEIFVGTPFIYSIPDVSPNTDALLQRQNWNSVSSGDAKFLKRK